MKTQQQKIELAQAITVTAELLGNNLSGPAAEIMVSDLIAYPHNQVLAALKRCRRELTGRLTIAGIIERIDDGRPGVEEAWSMLPRDEDTSVVWTAEMAIAWGVAARLLETDEIAARMAFKETYKRELDKARADQSAPAWTLSPGRSEAGRHVAVQEAVDRGRIPAVRASMMLPGFDNINYQGAMRLGQPATLGGVLSNMHDLESRN